MVCPRSNPLLLLLSSSLRRAHSLALRTAQGTSSQLRESFRERDAGNKGWLSARELKLAFASLVGYKPSKVEIQRVFGDVSTRGVAEEQFSQSMERILSLRDHDEHVRQIFKTFDYRCSGFINKADLFKVFSNCAPHIPQEVVSQAFDEVDADGDGRVSCREFVNIMHFRAPPH
uniref:Ef-hand calcium-binding domain-containing protein 11 n=2 Tax=Tetraselmis sp. GSL018 TaxID=582737 RepID=A0A061R8L4_9CHLO